MSEAGMKEALVRIAEAREAGGHKLNLHQLKLTQLPREILQLPELKMLGVSDNPLGALPEWLADLAELRQLRAMRCGLRGLPERLPARLEYLDVSLNELAELPAALTVLAQLKNLALVGNRLRALPGGIGKLANLTMLDVTANELNALPGSLARLESLERLDAGDNALSELPPVISKLTALRWLDLSSNGLQALPSVIGWLSNLTTLKLSLNALRTLPDSILELSKLRKLSLTHGQLSQLPDDIGALSSLEHLDLVANALTSLPQSIGQLRALGWLDVSHNQLTSLPRSLQDLSALERLYLHGNEGLGLPREVLGPSDLENPESARPADILSYYFRMRGEEQQNPLLEAKMLVLGQGGVGKTSLINRLVDDHFDDYEAKTQGIAIRRWPVQGRTTEESIQINVWDFGGQEIFYDMHQFFLTKRSLYLVVISARQGEDEGRLRRWLNLAQSYGGGSPVLVVVNQSDAHPLALDEKRLQADYPGLVAGCFYVSAKQGGAPLAELAQTIGSTIRAMPDVYDPVPMSFFRVKKQLQEWAEERNFVDIDEYRSLCEANDIVKDHEQEALIRLLHRLGSILHFNDPGDPYQLKETQVLNPAWVTGGIYQLLGSARLALQGGELAPADLRELLDEEQYPEKRHPFLLEMMRKFELLFDFPGQQGQRMLVPKLLPPAEPDLDWSPQDSLNFCYQCNVLPDGIVPRFIVQLHHRLGDKPTYWRSGVVLRIDAQRVLVRGDSHGDKIHIAVQGPREGRRRALSIVRDRFQAIFASLPGLGTQQMVPLPDRADIVVPYQELLDNLALGVNDIVKDGKKYAVQDLLDGIETPERRLDQLNRSIRAQRNNQPDSPPDNQPNHPADSQPDSHANSHTDNGKNKTVAAKPGVATAPKAGGGATGKGESAIAKDPDSRSPVREEQRMNATIRLLRELLLGLVVLGALLAGLERLVSPTFFPWVMGFIAVALLILIVFVWRRMRDISEAGAVDLLKHTVDKSTDMLQARRQPPVLDKPPEDSPDTPEDSPNTPEDDPALTPAGNEHDQLR